MAIHYYAACIAAYECMVMLCTLLVWEITVIIVVYLSPFSDQAAGSIWVVTLILVLVMSFCLDITQIYVNDVQEDVRSVMFYLVRAITNYIIYTFLITMMAFRDEFNIESKTFRNPSFRTIDGILADAISLSVGRMFITTSELVVSVIALFGSWRMD